MNSTRQAPIPYLPCVDYYRSLCAALLHAGAGEPGQLPLTRTTICGAWGEQTLTLPLQGGRRRLRSTPPDRLMLSEHGNWRHTHWQAITSAYGALPFFHLLQHMFAPAYASPRGLLSEFNSELHEAFMRATRLRELCAYLRQNPRRFPAPADMNLFPGHRAAIELLFARGPETIFYLLPSD